MPKKTGFENWNFSFTDIVRSAGPSIGKDFRAKRAGSRQSTNVQDFRTGQPFSSRLKAGYYPLTAALGLSRPVQTPLASTKQMLDGMAKPATRARQAPFWANLRGTK